MLKRREFEPRLRMFFFFKISEITATVYYFKKTMLTNKCEYYHHLLFSIIVLDGLMVIKDTYCITTSVSVTIVNIYILIHSAVCLLLLQDVNHLVFGSSFNESVTPMTTEEAMAQFQHYL